MPSRIDLFFWRGLPSHHKQVIFSMIGKELAQFRVLAKLGAKASGTYQLSISSPALHSVPRASVAVMPSQNFPMRCAHIHRHSLD